MHATPCTCSLHYNHEKNVSFTPLKLEEDILQQFVMQEKLKVYLLWAFLFEHIDNFLLSICLSLFFCGLCYSPGF
jgi:hypothetical protein